MRSVWLAILAQSQYVSRLSYLSIVSLILRVDFAHFAEFHVAHTQRGKVGILGNVSNYLSAILHVVSTKVVSLVISEFDLELPCLQILRFKTMNSRLPMHFTRDIFEDLILKDVSLDQRGVAKPI